MQDPVKPQNIEPEPTTDPVSQSIAELEELFGLMSTGWRVAVERLDPDWCSGHQGSYDYDVDEAPTIDWLKEKFGGRKFRARVYDQNNKYKGQRTIKIDDYPRRNGIRL